MLKLSLREVICLQAHNTPFPKTCGVEVTSTPHGIRWKRCKQHFHDDAGEGARAT